MFSRLTLSATALLVLAVPALADSLTADSPTLAPRPMVFLRDSDGMVISVLDCPYYESCRDVLNEGFTHRDLTCARIGCFAAAVKILADIPCTYEVENVGTGGGCRGVIERA